MTVKTCISKLKHSAGLNLSNDSLLRKNNGGGMAIMLLSTTIIILILLVFVNIADYALYSIKRNTISKGIDYAVCAAIQEIDNTESKSGLATGYDETTGKLSVDNIILNEVSADNAFYSTLQSNTGIDRDTVQNNVLTVIANPTDTVLEYIIKTGMDRTEGNVSSPVSLESVINNKINEYWNTSDPFNDNQIIYVNGNLKTNQFKKVPYYIVFIKNYEIDGLFRKRTATFVGFSGAKIERKN